ncbi:MAG: signal peptide peptidase SppA [Porphyromonadaceae bacterium]|nr:signal peptide peptidase SppA [Porphyromonadaceae bacterium]
MFFASLLGIIAGSGCLIFILFSLIAGAIASLATFGSSEAEPVAIKANTVLKINLSQISEIVESNPLDNLLSTKDQDEPVSLTEAVRAIHKAKNNPNISGIYLNVEDMHAGMASVDELRRALENFRGSGKFIVAYADNFSQKAYYLSSVADQVLLNPEGSIGIMGIASSTLMMRSALSKLGIKTEVFKVGTYKSAVEPFILDHMSEANKEQVQTYIDGLWSSITSTIAKARGIEADSVRAIAERGEAFAPAKLFVERKLIDTLVYRRDIKGLIADRMQLSKPEDVNMVTLSQMAAQPEVGRATTGDAISVIVAEGEIMPKMASLYSSVTSINYDLVDKLQKVAKNDDIKAVVLRISSPGGSAFLSEQIWREVKALRELKPVVVSMGDVAASGGYYIASAADRIVAEANTLTGSIGIFGMVQNASELASRLGVNLDIVKTSKFANLETGSIAGLPINPMTDEERMLIQRMVERGYETFLSRVAEGRNMTLEQVDQVAQGRVWLGRKALELGLVDELGGLSTAVEAAAKLANLSEYRLDYGETSRNIFSELLDSQSSSDFVAKLKYSFMSPRERELLLLLERQTASLGVQARLPYEISVY